ncbi:MAG: hypothetical protein GX309_10005 [Clostridiales bacterium]|nr:hypothetical protein [Clostridiales bacterium]
MNCFVDYRTTDIEMNTLKNFGLSPIKLPRTNLVYKAIDGHVDIQFNVLNKVERKVIVQRDISLDFLNILEKNNIKYVLSKNSLNDTYPKDIILNALITKEYFVHYTKYTDENLLKNVQYKKIVNVSQGYTKCSILPLKENVFVTNDKGIYNAFLKLDNVDVLYIPYGDIILPSMNYGFIGGIGGMLNENTLGTFGDINEYKYGNILMDFLKKHNITVLSLKPGKLIDRGSLFVV